MLTVNNHNESSLTVDIESWLADSDGKELKSSSTIQASRFTDVGTLGRLFVLLPAPDPIDMEMLFFSGFIIIPEVVGQLDEEKKL